MPLHAATCAKALTHLSRGCPGCGLDRSSGEPFHNGPARAFLASRSSHEPPDRPLPLPVLAAAAFASLPTPQLLRPENTADVDATRKDVLCSVPDLVRRDRRNVVAPGHHVVKGSSGRKGGANRVCRFEWIVPLLSNRPSDPIAD